MKLLQEMALIVESEELEKQLKQVIAEGVQERRDFLRAFEMYKKAQRPFANGAKSAESKILEAMDDLQLEVLQVDKVVINVKTVAGRKTVKYKEVVEGTQKVIETVEGLNADMRKSLSSAIANLIVDHTTTADDSKKIDIKDPELSAYEKGLKDIEDIAFADFIMNKVGKVSRMVKTAVRWISKKEDAEGVATALDQINGVSESKIDESVISDLWDKVKAFTNRIAKNIQDITSDVQETREKFESDLKMIQSSES